MKIVQISTYDNRGGAARAARRLHRGLLEIGRESRMLVRQKSLAEDSIYRVKARKAGSEASSVFFQDTVIQEHYIDPRRTEISNTMFSFPYPGYDLTDLALIRKADVINLHWVTGFQSPKTVSRLLALNKVVVWTLHDQSAFTGGCHYSAGCTKYQSDCGECPQLTDDSFGLPSAVLKDKRELFEKGSLTVVAPSRWMADCAGKSSLFRNSRIEVIPNSLETDVYLPQPKAEAKEELDIAGDRVVLLFAAEDGNEKRKGFRELIAAVQYCLSDNNFQGLVENGKITILCFGHPSDELESLGLPVLSMGYVDSDEMVSKAYAAADIFIQSSREDNLPNTILESMSCGTPVVAFEAGGMPDLVQNGLTGRLVPPGDPTRMGQAILSLIFDAEKRKVMQQECRKKIREGYGLDVQAKNYLALYEDLGRASKSVKKNTSTTPLEIDSEASAKALEAPVDPGLGSCVNAVYGRILFAALKQVAPEMQQQLERSENDRSARLEQVNELKEMLRQSESDREVRLEQTNKLAGQLEESERDRSARLEQINKLAGQLKESESDRGARLEQINKLAGQLKESESDRRARLEQINKLTALLKESEEGRAVRLEVIKKLETETQTLNDRLQQEMLRAETMERSHVIRVGRKVRLIRTERPKTFTRVTPGQEKHETE